MLKKILLILLSILFLSSCASVGKYDPNGDHVFWKIDNGKNTAYILGSIHVGRADVYPLPDTIENAFYESKNLAVELDLNNPNIDIQKILQYSMLSGDTTLQDLLPDSTYQLIQEKLHELINPLFINKYRPWFAIIAIQQNEMMQAGFNSEDGIDKYFIRKAEKFNKKVIELEELEDQLKILTMFDKQPTEYLHYTLNELKDTEVLINKMYEAWKKGNLIELEEFVSGQTKEFPELDKLMDEILFKRNLKMAKKIDGILESGETSFIVVGSAHLIGKKSIIDILQKSGKYNIDRI